MVSWNLRPTFELPIDVSRSEAIDRLAQDKAAHQDDALFLMFGEYGELHVHESEHRIWTPHLSFYVAESSSGARIHGRYAPRLEVWTFVWIVYLAMAFSVFFGLAFAYAQWMLQETQWAWWIVIPATLVLVSVYVAASIGQQWSSDQMEDLHDRLIAICDRTALLSGQARPKN